MFLLFLYSSGLACQGIPKQTNFVRGRIMEAKCNEIERDTDIKIELNASIKEGQAYIIFTNRTNTPLWFPSEQEPAFRPDYGAQILHIWFGYYDEVYGECRGSYMVPPMQLVPPGSILKVEITSQTLVNVLFKRNLSIQLQARITTKALTVSKTRGEQPLEDYIENSCILKRDKMHL